MFDAVGMAVTGAPVGFAESGLFLGMAMPSVAVGFAAVGVELGVEVDFKVPG